MLNCPNRLAWASVDWCGGWLNCTLANLPASRAPLLRSRSSLLQSGPRFRFSLSLNFRIKGLSRLAFSLSVRPGSECTTAGAWNLDPLSAQEHKRTPAGKSRAHPVLFTGWRLQLLPARFSLGSSPDQRCPCVPDLFPGSSQFDSLILHPSPLPTAWFSVLLLAIARPVWTPVTRLLQFFTTSVDLFLSLSPLSRFFSALSRPGSLPLVHRSNAISTEVVVSSKTKRNR